MAGETTVGSIKYDLDLDDKKFKSGMSGARDDVKGLKGHMEKAEGASQGMLLGMTALAAGAVAFGVKSVQAFNESTAATTKLRTNMLNVKGATDEHVKSLEGLAAQLQSVGVIEDDVIKAGMSQLATFNLQSKTIETLTPKITDMVAQLKGHNATAEDMVGINNLVGKVMTGNVSALSRYGVTLSDNQKKLLENGNETQRAAVLTEVLSQNYGKVNEALRKTPQGIITGLKNDFGDLMEVVGEAIMTAIIPFAEAFSKLVAGLKDDPIGKLTAKIKELQPYLGLIIGALAGSLIPAIGLMILRFAQAMVVLSPWMALGAAIGFVVQKLVEHFGGWGATLDALRGYWDGFMNTIRPFLPLFFPVVALFNWLKDLMPQIVPWVQQLWTNMGGLQGILTAMQPVLDFFRAVWNELWGIFATIAGFIIGSLIPAIVNTWNMLVQFGVVEMVINIVKGAVMLLVAAFKILWPAVRSLFDVIMTQLLPALLNLWQAIAPVLIPVLMILMGALAVVAGIIIGVVVGALWLVINVIKIVVFVFSGLIQVFAFVIGVIGGIFAGVVTILTLPFRIAWNIITGIMNGGSFGSIFRSIVSSVAGALGGVWDAITSPFRRAFDWIKNAVGGVVDKLKGLNPFQRHSPSLVDLVTRGTERITDLYGNMFGQLQDMSAHTTPALVAGVNSSMGATINVNQYGDNNFTSESDEARYIDRLTRNLERVSSGMATR